MSIKKLFHWSFFIIGFGIILTSFYTVYAAPTEITISGEVKTSDGVSPILAHAHLMAVNDVARKPMQSKQLDSNGIFKMEVKEPGLYMLWITAVNHPSRKIPILIEMNQAKIGFKLILGSYNENKTNGPILICGDWNKFNPETAAVMQKQADGTYYYELNTTKNKISYQIVGFEEYRNINGTMSTSYEYVDYGEYRSVLSVKSGNVKIVFDPAKIITSNNQPKIQFNETFNYLDKVFASTELFEQTYTEYENFQLKQEIKFDPHQLQTYLEEQLRLEENPVIRKFAAIYLVQMLEMGATFNQELNEIILNVIPPESPLWSMEPYAVSLYCRNLQKEKASQILQDFLNKNSDRAIQAHALINLALNAKNSGDIEQQKTYFKLLTDKYSDIESISDVIKSLNPK